jgi:uncharacterized protein YjbI with pentapeptide repeats
MRTPHRDEWSGQRFDDADFSYARLHSPNFEGVKITDGWCSTLMPEQRGMRLGFGSGYVS